MLKKFDYEKHPDAKKLVQTEASNHIPEWRRRYKPIAPVFQEPDQNAGTTALPEKKGKRPRRPKRQEAETDSTVEQLSIIPARKEDFLP